MRKADVAGLDLQEGHLGPLERHVQLLRQPRHRSWTTVPELTPGAGTPLTAAEAYML